MSTWVTGQPRAHHEAMAVEYVWSVLHYYLGHNINDVLLQRNLSGEPSVVLLDTSDGLTIRLDVSVHRTAQEVPE